MIYLLLYNIDLFIQYKMKSNHLMASNLARPKITDLPIDGLHGSYNLGQGKKERSVNKIYK